MLGEGFADRTASLKGGNRSGAGRRVLGRDLVFGGGYFEVLELQLHLFDQPGTSFGALAKLLAPKLGDLQPQMRDHRLRGRDDRARLCQLCLRHPGAGVGRGEFGTKSGDLGGTVGHS